MCCAAAPQPGHFHCRWSFPLLLWSRWSYWERGADVAGCNQFGELGDSRYCVSQWLCMLIICVGCGAFTAWGLVEKDPSIPGCPMPCLPILGCRETQAFRIALINQSSLWIQVTIIYLRGFWCLRSQPKDQVKCQPQNQNRKIMADSPDMPRLMVMVQFASWWKT